MKTLTLTPAQIQNFIYLLDGSPTLLSEFYLENYDKVYKKKNDWIIPIDSTCEKWLKRELKSYIKHLREEIKEVGNGEGVTAYWIDEAKEHKNRIALAQRVLIKLN